MIDALRGRATVAVGTWYTLRLDVSGSTLRDYLNGTLVASATDSTFGSGRIGLATYNTDVGVACQANAGCMVEGNYFEDVEEPVSNHYAGPAGRCVARNNVFVGESGVPDCSGSVQEPSTYYSYTLDDPNGVKATVMAGAGTGKLGL